MRHAHAPRLQDVAVRGRRAPPGQRVPRAGDSPRSPRRSRASSTASAPPCALATTAGARRRPTSRGSSATSSSSTPSAIPRRWALEEVTRFLSSLAVDGQVAASTQNQALSALLFLYRDPRGTESEGTEVEVRRRCLEGIDCVDPLESRRYAGQPIALSNSTSADIGKAQLCSNTGRTS